MVGITRSKVIFCFAVLRVLLHSEAWYILKGMTRLSIYMEVIDKQKCCKCKNETNPMNTNTVVSVVNTSGNITTKTATRKTNKGN